MYIIKEYNLNVEHGVQGMHLRWGSKLLSIQSIDNKIVVWVLEYTNETTTVTYMFYLLKTDWEGPDIIKDLEYINTVQVENENYHIFTENK